MTFLDYDMNLVNLRNNYLIAANQILSEDAPPDQVNTSANASWYIKWKSDTVTTFRNSFAKARQYAQKMHDKYTEWLKKNREFFDTAKYGVPAGCTVSHAPDYRQAIFRIKEPIANALNGIALDKISVGDDPRKSDGNNPNNRWFMKFLIKDYNGAGNDFTKYAQEYYNGQDNTNTINTHDMRLYIPIMYNYCLNYMTTIAALEQQMNIIISWINLDPVSREQGNSNTAQQQYNAMVQKQNNGIASTNPQQNVVHANAQIFQEFNTVPQGSIGKPVSNVKTANTNSFMAKGANKGSSMGIKQFKPQQQQQQKSLQPGNQKQLIMKKKQVAVNIVKDCFAAKVTAAGRVYRDFISTLQTYIYGVQQHIERQNNQKKAKKKK